MGLLILFALTFLSVFHFGSCFWFNATVSLDGTTPYKSITEALNDAPDNSNSRYYIHVMPGVYYERVVILPQKTFIALIGDDPSTTIIVDNRSNRTGFGTTDSATFSVYGANFMAQSITFKNSAGPDHGQAVALVNKASMTSYYRCVFLGYQDTLFTQGLDTFFKECDIYGTVDFIFGESTAVFQDCKIYGRLPNTTITITAQSKDNPDMRSGFSFQNCVVTASPELVSGKDDVVVFLGRPWRNYSTVVFMDSYLDDVVDPRGWMQWGNNSVDLLYYAEFNNNGGGADTSKRVQWPSYHVLNDREEVTAFTVQNLINGNQWLPETGVPFRSAF